MKQDHWSMGIDWGRKRHQVCVTDAAGAELGHQSFEHSGAGLMKLVQWCLQITGGAAADVAVAIETPRGPVVEILLAREFAVHSINPMQSSRFRDRYSPSGAKDDRRDAKVLADALRTDPQAFRMLESCSEQTTALTHLMRSYDHLVDERVRLSNQFNELLWSYYPQFLELGGELILRWKLALWEKLPNPHQAHRVRTTGIEKILRKHGAWKTSAEDVLEILRQPGLELPAFHIKALVMEGKLLVERLELVERQLSQVRRQFDECLQNMSQADTAAHHREASQDPSETESTPAAAAIIQSVPGAGRIVTATLLSKAGDAIADHNYQALRCLCGVAPVTQQSGTTKRIRRRRAADKKLCQAAYHMARVAIQHDAVSRRKYHSLRKRGHSHGRALRGVADRLLAVVCVMLRDGTLFEHRDPPEVALPSAA